MMKKVSTSALLLVALGLTGCSNLLYSGKTAPVYSGQHIRNSSGRAVTIINPNTSGSTVNMGYTTNAIENPQGVVNAGAIENPNAVPMVVNNSQNSPYVMGGAARPVGMTNTNPQQDILGQNDALTAVNSVSYSQQGTQGVNNGTMQQAQANAAMQQAQAMPVGSQVQSKAQSALPSTAVSRPTAVVNNQVAQQQVPQQQVPQQTPPKQAVTQQSTKANPSAPQSATKSLLQQARAAVSAGDYDKAASALERAYRIEPGNAKILYDIAQIRYAQGNYVQAQSFAGRAASYTAGNPKLAKKVWTILANSRKALGNASGAAAAAQKAASFK